MSERWSRLGVGLHWGSAAVIVGLAAAGFVMTELPGDSSARLLLSRAHTALGLTLMVGTVARLLARRRAAGPAPLPLSALHRRGVAVVHGALYAVLFGLGASGVATGARSAWPRYLRGELREAPGLEALASRELHEALVFALISLVALHVGGVLVHEARVGGALRRMLPARAHARAEER